MLGKADIDDIAAAFGQTLRAYRVDAGLSQERLALEAGLQRNYISMLELGRYQPTIGTLFKVALVLNQRPEDLIQATRIALVQGPTR